MKETDLSKLEETVNRYLNSQNEDYVNDFNHMVKVFDDYGVNDGELVDKVVKHYYNKLLVDGKLAKDHTQYNKQQLINGKTVLEQWVGAIENEKRIEYLTLFNSIYQKANIPTKVCLYGHKERKNTEFVKAMQLRGEKVKKEDLNVALNDEKNTAQYISKTLSSINTLGEEIVFEVHQLMNEGNDESSEKANELAMHYRNQFANTITEMKDVMYSNGATDKEVNDALNIIFKQFIYYQERNLFNLNKDFSIIQALLLKIPSIGYVLNRFKEGIIKFIVDDAQPFNAEQKNYAIDALLDMAYTLGIIVNEQKYNELKSTVKELTNE